MLHARLLAGRVSVLLGALKPHSYRNKKIATFATRKEDTI